MSRVLLVAEKQPLREELARAIAGAPHTVKISAPGDLRLEAARDWNPDIIVMDLSTDGAALPLRIDMLKDPALARVPFVVVGGSEDEARALGAHAFVSSAQAVESLMGLLSHFSMLASPLPL